MHTKVHREWSEQKIKRIRVQKEKNLRVLFVRSHKKVAVKNGSSAHFSCLCVCVSFSSFLNTNYYITKTRSDKKMRIQKVNVLRCLRSMHIYTQTHRHRSHEQIQHKPLRAREQDHTYRTKKERSTKRRKKLKTREKSVSKTGDTTFFRLFA